jgi:hypothetical protein
LSAAEAVPSGLSGRAFAETLVVFAANHHVGEQHLQRFVTEFDFAGILALPSGTATWIGRPMRSSTSAGSA